MYGKSPGFFGIEFGVYVVMRLYLEAYSFSFKLALVFLLQGFAFLVFKLRS